MFIFSPKKGKKIWVQTSRGSQYPKSRIYPN